MCPYNTSHHCIILLSACKFGFYYSYGGDDGETVDETSPLTDTPRAQRLIDAEKFTHDNGGAVLRLAGLYLLERGAHNFWLMSGKDVSGRADGIINLLHYDDAAGACMAALKVGAGDGIYLVSDGNPLSREGICAAALKHPMYDGKSMPKFLGAETDSKGKIYDGSWSNEKLKWQPRYSSFEGFMS
jgi:nucleoside-diphosphate-sugar epimerase